MNSLISLIFIPRGKRKAQILKTKGSLKKKPRLGYIVEENQAFWVLFSGFDLVVSRNGLAQVMAHRKAKLLSFLLFLDLLFH